MPNFDIVCVGDAKIDIFLILPESNPYVQLENNKLCLEYGQKIPIDSSPIMLGGNAANTAVGISRLGFHSAIITEIGNDDFSDRVINNLKDENVCTDYVIRNTLGHPSFSIILNYKKDRTIFGQHCLREHNFSFDNFSAKMVYLTSLGNNWENAYLKTLDFVKKSQAKLAFNPGSLQLKERTEKIKNILEATDILFINKQEAEEILSEGKDKVELSKEILEAIQKYGPKTVVVTDAANGSYAINDKGEYIVQPCVKAEIMEATGAGDAYASGFLGAILYNHSLQEAMRWGSLNAASTMELIGAQNGLLFKDKMEKKYAEQSWI